MTVSVRISILDCVCTALCKVAYKNRANSLRLQCQDKQVTYEGQFPEDISRERVSF